MKNRILLLSIFIVGISILTSAQSMLIVNLVYDNSGLTPIKNTQVLLKLNGSTIATALTDTTGHCSFNNLMPGTYQCIPVCTIPWGGCNASDCLAIMMNFINGTGGFLTGLKLAAAEVNGMGPNGNALDALLVCKRFVNLIGNFWPPYVVPGQPDWKYETINISITAPGTFAQQIKMICTGDVNGSYIP